MFHEKTTHAARGKWRGILQHFGVPKDALSGKHTSCPICGGTDRFRFDDKDRRGTWICNHCGAGDGLKLAMDFTGLPFRDVASQIDAILGNVKPDGVQVRDISDDDRRRMLREAWSGSKPVQPGDLAHKYLASRGVDEVVYPDALRFHPTMRDGEGGVRPCLVAMVGVYGAERYATMHRTFLRPDGMAKAEMTAPRKLMPGPLPDGACVALSRYTGGPLGIAEGVETAMSASALYGLPVWAAINATMMEKWTPPDGCEEVAVFGDNDPGFGGQAAAYRLAHRLAGKGLHVTVHIPDMPGDDWNDVHLRRKAAA